ncbi:MAG: ABC transporter permease [Armatimonadetes bacterium]|nr:ABC transporter permease [Armatimonadota bacterium]MDE2206188.1 ABC transporter permease [Armatimonadota bacterium]
MLTGLISNRISWRQALVSVGVGLLLAAIIMQAAGFNALHAFQWLFSGASGLRFHNAGAPSFNLYNAAQSLAQAVPLLLCGMAVAVAFRAGLFNIGGQGQMALGALAAGIAGLAAPRSGWGAPWVCLALLAGASAGAALAAVAALLKAWRGVHEVLSTIMLNFIAINICTYIASGPLRDPHSMATQTPGIGAAAHLHAWVTGSNLNAGLILALLLAAGSGWLLQRTSLGFAIRAVGANPRAAEASGISIAGATTWAMAISGALAGVAGALAVLGVQHRYVEGIAGNFGFDGISVALLGGIVAPGVIVSSLFFGALANGAAVMQLQVGVPDAVATVVQAAVILMVAVRPGGGLRPARRVPAETPGSLHASG